jgi:hypothetical protein
MERMMINAFSSQTVALSFVKTAADNVRSWNASVQKDHPTTLFTLLEKSDPEKAEALRKEQAQVRELIEQLRSSQKDVNERRKEAARQKVERLKAEIAALRMMASSDPEAVARQAARLARELSAAAKEYAAAGGSANSITTAVSIGPTTPTVAESTQTATSVPTDTKTVADTQSAKSAHQDAPTTDDDRTAFREKINEQIADAQKQFASTTEDETFIRTVRHLMNELKAIIKNAQLKIQLENGTSSDRNVEDAEKALRDTQASLNAISTGALSSVISVNIAI